VGPARQSLSIADAIALEALALDALAALDHHQAICKRAGVAAKNLRHRSIAQHLICTIFRVTAVNAITNFAADTASTKTLAISLQTSGF